jgi:UDP-N-acetylmuramate dehydrogenase
MSEALQVLIARLVGRFGPDRVKKDEVLAAYTTFRVGGPADVFLETRNSREILDAVAIAAESGVPVRVLGGGSNVLIADAGVRGLVIRPRGGEVQQIAPQLIRVDAAVTINGLVRWTVGRGVAGLEAWAGTPGTVGGAIFGNAHFGGRLIGELVHSVRLVDTAGRQRVLAVSEMAFGYDRSRLQDTGEILLSADFQVTSGDPVTLRATARESLAFRKRTQPLDTPSAGCIFQNPEPGRDRVPDGMPWSAGALVDRAGLKGHRVGGARVSPTHGNFIVNEGGATAENVRLLIETCRCAVREQFGVELRDEIVYFGQHAV